MNTFYHGDCKFVMNHDIEPESVDLIYLDPPFFTGKVQKGKKWRPEAMEISFDDTKSYWGKHQEEMRRKAPLWLNSIPRSDEFKAYLYYMMVRLELCKRVLKSTGSIYLHCDWHASHYLKMVMDEIFGEDNFQNEIIWHYTGGGRSKTYFSSKHDNIYFYTKSNKHTFNIDAIRVPYKESSGYAHGGIISNGKQYMPNPLGTPIDDVWDIPIINPLSKERMGYPTQKPLTLLERIIKASSNEGDTILDPFCGCGTTIIASQTLGRQWIGIDINKEAYNVSKDREHQLKLEEQQADYRAAKYIERDIDEVMKMEGSGDNEFEKWVNQFYGATKPHTDKEVDGITKDGIPIQVKAHKTEIDSPDIHKFNSAIDFHPELRVIKPNTAYYVSKSGFTNRARELVSELKERGKIDIKLREPKDLLPSIDQSGGGSPLP